MCGCEAHRELVDCTCSCDHRSDVARLWRERGQQLEHKLAVALASIEAVAVLANQAEAGEGIVLYPGHREYHTVEVGLLRTAIAVHEPIAQLWTYEELLDLLADKERRLNAVHDLVEKPTFKVGRLVTVDALRKAVS